MAKKKKTPAAVVADVAFKRIRDLETCARELKRSRAAIDALLDCINRLHDGMRQETREMILPETRILMDIAVKEGRDILQGKAPDA